MEDLLNQRTSYQQQIFALLKDIRFWIVFFFLLRMYAITFPPLEVGHNWRQTDGMMIARNFYEHDANILYPRVDLAGDKSGIVGCEFPILNYLVYLVSLVFGFEHWYGRIIVLIFSSLGTLFFHKLVKKYFGERAALYASIILLVSLWFSYSRKNIPDAFAASLCLISLYYAFRYFETGKFPHLFLFCFAGLFGCLSKILTATILTVLLIPILDGKIPLTRKVMLTLSSLVILAGVCWWYFIWVPHLNSTYGFGDHFFMGMTFSQGFTYISNNLPLVLKRFYSTPLKYVGFLTFIAAVVLVIRQKRWLALAAFLLPFLSFLILLVKTGASIIGDLYYIITAIPAMAFITGYGLASINNKKIAIGLLIIIGIESISSQIYEFRLREPYTSLRNLEAIMDEVSQRDDLIAINAEEVHNPTAMYFAHRRGWASPNPMLADPAYRKDLEDKGCRFVVIVKKLYGDIDLGYTKVHDSEYFKIYRIK